MTNALPSLLLASLIACGGVSSALAATAPGIIPTGDAFVDGATANQNNNYGAAGALSVAAMSASPSQNEFDSLVRFNLASTDTYFNGIYGAGNWTVQSITLQLTATAPNNAIFNGNSTASNAAGSFSVRLTASDSWIEGTGSPNTPDTNAADVNFANQGNYLSAANDQTLGTFSFAGRDQRHLNLQSRGLLQLPVGRAERHRREPLPRRGGQSDFLPV